jgi:NAD(P)-dependent dehydrogenase (short-subunit alcohol dehydrogenase family)
MANGEYRVEGKVAIVTGAGRGIGKAIALMLAEGGADVTVISRTAKNTEQTAEEIRKMGRKALAITMDVTQVDQVEKAVEKTVSEFGKVDILVNNAGIQFNRPVAYVPGAKFLGWEITEGNWDKPYTVEEWHQIMDTNLTSAFLFARTVGPYFLKQRKGKVVNVSSTAAEQGVPYTAPYAASKGGLSTFSRVLSSEWAEFGITVNAVAPGGVDTDLAAPFLTTPEARQALIDLIPLGRIAQPRDVALLVLFLCSEASDYITGQTITTDGGAMGRGPGI